MYSPKIVKIKPNSETYGIIVLFSNGITKEVDMLQKLNEELYFDIKDKNRFEQAQIDSGGYGVSWNDDVDISEFELWNIGCEIDYKW
ncbi:DUF2442 domain-containing protein [Clostridium tagluense]|uniref:DUF2442 domain-containing protein n=1 Tax=Clostridium tagluense TaxID=360422 RepID=UPI001C0D6DB8|nr:DUF2442 domain-containing protein [Clostridium tagluense]MBU3127132.1 DUF2442 domain-containing protein [Clostridium tagluense]MCB2312000.1 DUF2442 domain-containing protein [Clostridium tagluense]MCB2316587.1 DUF2442 domain-containing protein [Clostridium tagluense]MCB2321477.1 DUF2442 domain-containing protein [Clostridium tagluense]MCB2326489.1 DUF2442 domain-containing protein [Clostridium tagluense]